MGFYYPLLFLSGYVEGVWLEAVVEINWFKLRVGDSANYPR